MKFSEPLKTQNPFIIINSLDSGEKEIRWVQRSFLEFIFWNFHNLAWSESNPTKITKNLWLQMAFDLFKEEMFKLKKYIVPAVHSSHQNKSQKSLLKLAS